MLRTINASLELMHMMPVADQEKHRQKRYDFWQTFCGSLFLSLFLTLVNFLYFFKIPNNIFFNFNLISPVEMP